MASYKITKILDKNENKNKKPFGNGNVIKEYLVVSGDSLFNEFKKGK
jgi:hypothetical protein